MPGKRPHRVTLSPCHLVIGRAPGTLRRLHMEQPIPGQRWVSDSEPELGLGMVIKQEFGRVHVHFPAANEQRQYALKSAPLRRVRYHEGDHIKVHDGSELTVVTIEEKDGLLVYHGAERAVAEAELSDTISFSKPEDR